MSGSPLRIATARDVDALSQVLARGFGDDPIWRWMAPTGTRWPDRLGPIFRHLLRPPIGFGATWTTDDLEGTAVWSPPGRSGFPNGAAVRSAPTMLRGFGPAGIRRTLRLVARMEKAHPPEPHWYLELLATDAHLRGRGVGSRLIGPGLDRADAEGVGAYLESSKWDNVPFYRRHGFEVIEEMVAVPGSPPMWRMWRDPR
ncbi:MAG TPA: GNAT family N-acetyltransferase [Microthrixaceae bacterium]|nr:GNAT family N-acetyltransferase [Microthrixaceae bacterium]HNH38656.1 GNAT family N-acetyltransferase [Microthrixaceae bacterium]